jgi:polyribonucleotide nucleotidyltransferase
VAGTARGVTAIQMDNKIGGVSRDVLLIALKQARDGRLYILERMNAALSEPRQELSPYAPRIYTIHIKPERIREIIGPGGKIVRGIQEQTGVKIDIEDDGTVRIAAVDPESARKAIEIVQGIVQEPEVGKVYQGKVKKIMDFGAFVEIYPGTEGLLHISQISKHRIRAVSDVLKEGDEVTVRLIELERDGKMRLSRREFEPEGFVPPLAEPSPVPAAREAREGGGGDRGKDRDRGRGDRRGRR